MKRRHCCEWRFEEHRAEDAASEGVSVASFGKIRFAWEVGWRGGRDGGAGGFVGKRRCFEGREAEDATSAGMAKREEENDAASVEASTATEARTRGRRERAAKDATVAAARELE